MSGLGISLSRLGGTVCNGCVFFDQLYVDNNCAQVESIKEGASVKATSHDFFFRTTVRGLAELRFSLFPVGTSVLCLCLAISAGSIERAFVCLKYLLRSEYLS